MDFHTVRRILGATALCSAAIVTVGFVTAMGCSSSSSSDNGSGDSSTGDTQVGDVHLDTRDGHLDTRDGHTDTTEAGPDTNPEFDTTPGDIGPGDSSSLFPCGTESCNTLLEFCHVDPGCDVTPPPPDAGTDTATDETDADGGAGDASSTDTTPAETGACARHCETYADADASTCLGFPSCTCISAILCGSIDNASCDDSSGGVVVSCKTP